MKKTPLTLKNIRPSYALQKEYQKKLDALIVEMSKSTHWWLMARYKSTGLALDASPIEALKKELSGLRNKWQKRFDEESTKLAKMFANQVLKVSDYQLSSAFRSLGLEVDLKISDRVKHSVQAVIQENVNLIRSLPTHYYTQIETVVMMAASRGRDASWLSEELKHRFGITQRRAVTIARDQNNKASSVIQSARQQEVGITQGIWQHSGGGKKPRHSHQKAGRDKLIFDLAKGAYIDGEYILPGEKSNCRCTWKAVIPGFTKLTSN